MPAIRAGSGAGHAAASPVPPCPGSGPGAGQPPFPLRLRTAMTAALAASLAAATSTPALADEPPRAVELTGSYVADAAGVVDGPRRGLRFVDLLRIDATADLDRIAGWQGARLVATFEAGTGAQPKLLAGTLEGFDNAETTLNRPRLFQAYLKQDLGHGGSNLKLGFIDLNAEFYATAASSLLLAPPFGIGSELAATGPNGPSIFPSTAPTVALTLVPARNTYLGLAVINAEARAIGDPGGPAPLLREGALLIGEAGWTGVGGQNGGGKLALGGWAYTRRQDDERDVDAAGVPVRRRAWGIYGLIEQPLGSAVTAFLRGGISDGNTGPFSGSLQAGVLVAHVLPGRPDSRLSAGLHAGFLAAKYRANLADAGDPQRPLESGWELAYHDRLAPWLAVQPDLQFVRTTERNAGSRDAVIATLRLTFTPPGQD